MNKNQSERAKRTLWLLFLLLCFLYGSLDLFQTLGSHPVHVLHVLHIDNLDAFVWVGIVLLVILWGLVLVLALALDSGRRGAGQ